MSLAKVVHEIWFFKGGLILDWPPFIYKYIYIYSLLYSSNIHPYILSVNILYVYSIFTLSIYYMYIEERSKIIRKV